MRHLFIYFMFAMGIAATSSGSIAAPASPQVRGEVESLLNALKDSGCQFNRNGTWYTGAQAQAHLTKKLEYLEGKNLISSAEDFISIGASTSSLSGRPYLVKCGTTPALESKAWLKERLKTLRQIQ